MVNIDEVFAIIGIDPGTESMGLSILWYDPKKDSITDIESYTFLGSKLPGRDITLQDVHGSMFDRLNRHKLNLINIFNNVKPFIVACESSYFNRAMPSAHAALVTTIHVIREALIEYDVNLKLTLIPPSNAKNAIGAKGGDKKDAIKIAIKQCKDLPINKEYIDGLTEHAIDAIAIAKAAHDSWKKIN